MLKQRSEFGIPQAAPPPRPQPSFPPHTNASTWAVKRVAGRRVGRAQGGCSTGDRDAELYNQATAARQGSRAPR